MARVLVLKPRLEIYFLFHYNKTMLKKEIQTLIVSDQQLAIDHEMVPYDIWGSTAHVVMLIKTGIVSPERGKLILEALKKITEQYEQGKFQIDPSRGAQLTLEKAIVDIAGDEAGLSTHTARSRNDQVMVTETLYIRDQVITLFSLILDVMQPLLEKAIENKLTPMPGYTHMQPGKPTTFCNWCLSFFDAFERGFNHLAYTLSAYDRSPLGAVESFGTSWQIDREFTAKLLGFNAVWEVPQDAISHRGVFQLSILGALSELAVSLSKIATDLLLYSTFEYNLVDFGEEVAQRMHPQTGSSVMPQKRNPDALELVRGISPQISAAFQAAFGVLNSLPSGYNRDSREIKEYIALGMTKTAASLSALKHVVQTLKVNAPRMKSLVEENYSLTTDIADYLSQITKQPYRLVYKIVGKAADECITQHLPLKSLSHDRINAIAKELGANIAIKEEDIRTALDVLEMLSRRNHIGGTAPERSEAMCKERMQTLEKMRRSVSEKEAQILAAKEETAKQAQGIIA
jgi:argininosuccinate lyase